MLGLVGVEVCMGIGRCARRSCSLIISASDLSGPAHSSWISLPSLAHLPLGSLPGLFLLFLILYLFLIPLAVCSILYFTSIPSELWKENKKKMGEKNLWNKDSWRERQDKSWPISCRGVSHVETEKSIITPRESGEQPRTHNCIQREREYESENLLGMHFF